MTHIDVDTDTDSGTDTGTDMDTGAYPGTDPVLDSDPQRTLIGHWGWLVTRRTRKYPEVISSYI